ncbi:8380_t:CDS:1, partial [Paraglomus occultum]
TKSQLGKLITYSDLPQLPSTSIIYQGGGIEKEELRQKSKDIVVTGVCGL